MASAPALVGLTFGFYLGCEEPVSVILRRTSRAWELADQPYKTDPSPRYDMIRESYLGSQPYNLASLNQGKYKMSRQTGINHLEIGRALLSRSAGREASQMCLNSSFLLHFLVL